MREATPTGRVHLNYCSEQWHDFHVFEWFRPPTILRWGPWHQPTYPPRSPLFAWIFIRSLAPQVENSKSWGVSSQWGDSGRGRDKVVMGGEGNPINVVTEPFVEIVYATPAGRLIWDCVILNGRTTSGSSKLLWEGPLYTGDWAVDYSSATFPTIKWITSPSSIFDLIHHVTLSELILSSLFKTFPLYINLYSDGRICIVLHVILYSLHSRWHPSPQ